jgi:Uma2 family endonuclease
MPVTAPVSTSPLLEGDSMSSDEFILRWEGMPDLRRAELIDGIVYMPSPVSRDHSECDIFLGGWLYTYAAATPGCLPNRDATWKMGPTNVPQPDLALTILPEYGGQSGVDGEYHAGAPELIVEVTVSSYSRDFGAKKRLYERMGVQEYLIALPRDRPIVAFSLSPSGFQEFRPESGILKSRAFPGLWLDLDALWALDIPRLNANLQQGIATPEHAAFTALLAERRR